MTQAHALPDPHDHDAWRVWANTQLKPLDLTVELLHTIVEAGQRKKDAASPLSPTSKPSYDRWGETVVCLREYTGWDVDESDQLSRTVHPSGKFYIVVRTGNGGVGMFGHCPSPKNKLGTTLRDLIDGTPSTAPLFEVGSASFGDPAADNRPHLWLLMMALHQGVLHAELSRPATRVDNKITEYYQRIPLPPLPYARTGTNVTITPDDDLDTGPVIDVQPI